MSQGNEGLPKKELKLKDFGFLAANGKLNKMEARFNSNTSDKLFVKASFKIDNKRDDTEVGVYVTGRTFDEVLSKLHDWHENYFTHIKVFGRLTGRENDTDKKVMNSMPF